MCLVIIENEKPSSTRALENEKSRKRKSRNENLKPRKCEFFTFV